MLGERPISVQNRVGLFAYRPLSLRTGQQIGREDCFVFFSVHFFLDNIFLQWYMSDTLRTQFRMGL